VDVAVLARDARTAMAAARPDAAGRAACLMHWQARTLLARIAQDPDGVETGRVAMSEFGKRARLLAAVLRRRV
jgi:hypothetical protein